MKEYHFNDGRFNNIMLIDFQCN